MAEGQHDPFHHVRDFPYFETPRTLGLGWEFENQFGDVVFGIPLPSILGFQLTKFMVLEVVAAVLVFLVFWGLARRVKDGQPVKGRFWNFWETLVVYFRNEVVRPTIGHGHHDDHGHEGHTDENALDSIGEPDHPHGERPHGSHPHDEADHLADDEAAPLNHVMAAPHAEGGSHPADRYLPIVLSFFFFVLFNNLLGMIPWMGSATGNLNVTGVLAVCAFGATLFYGMQEMGVVGFWKNLCPSMDVPGPIGLFLVPMVWAIEFVGLLIKHGVLAVRLFANIMAGHTVIGVMLSFIAGAVGSWLIWIVAPASVLGQVGISLLELFVAFLQAYVFAFLATLFIASVIHEH